MQGYFGVKITPLGANLVLLEEQEEGEIKALMEDAGGWLEQWFKEIRSWSTGDVDNERLVWLRVYGIPVHAWNDNFFTLISQPFGTFLNTDESTSKKLTMDVARIMIRTPGLKAVDDFLSVKINDELFQLRIIEDSLGPMRIAIPPNGTKEGRDAASSSSEDDEGDFPAMGEEEVAEEREEIEGGQHLLAITNCINTNDSPINGYGNISLGSNEKEDSKESSNNFNDEENLNFSNSKDGENLGEAFKELVVVDLEESNEVDFSKGPSHSICHCSQRRNAIGGENSRSLEMDKLTHKPKSVSIKGGKGEQRGGVSKNSDGVDRVGRKPKSSSPNGDCRGGNGDQEAGGSSKGAQKGSKLRPISAVGRKGIEVSVTGGEGAQTNSLTRIQKPATTINPTTGCPPRTGVSSANSSSRRNPAVASSASIPTVNTMKEGCSRNPVGRFKAVKAKENSLSSAGSILCCSSLNSVDIRNCNKQFWNKHELEANGKVWKDVKDLGVEGDEEDTLYVERLKSNEESDREARRLREQSKQGLP
ncbi:DUF4283 domain protein [Trifolium medium]|uniref:DUF4283 domain protein n=1 Tax=Trifolium medium TaxID=97028 RepID=A0A392MCB8_9FABA|nr:DUF4283 domain protein [Trifolium medium]